MNCQRRSFPDPPGAAAVPGRGRRRHHPHTGESEGNLMKNSLVRIGLAAALALTSAAGLAACSGSDSGAAPAGAESSAAAPAAQGDDAATKEDLTKARQVVLDTLAENGDLPQVYLANDVDKPTEKYGMLVVPYDWSDSTEKLTTSIVKIDGGKFVIGALAKESQKEYQIDQDGTITEVTK